MFSADQCEFLNQPKIALIKIFYLKLYIISVNCSFKSKPLNIGD
jgi:hypothetical protein